MNRQDLLDRLKAGDRILVARILDITESVSKHHTVEAAEFYDPNQQALISPVLSKVPAVSFIWDGGYASAERQRLIVFPDYFPETEVDRHLAVLAVSINPRFESLSHRDFLGGILGLGIKREKLGDILVSPKGCQIIADRDIATYIVHNLAKVGRVRVRVEEIKTEAITQPSEKAKEISATVSSLRLDAVIAAGYGNSRSKMVSDITSEKVRVNWAVVTDPAYQLKQGDKISIRGLGRIEFSKVNGQTKKGRFSVLLKRFQ